MHSFEPKFYAHNLKPEDKSGEVIVGAESEDTMGNAARHLISNNWTPSSGEPIDDHKISQKMTRDMDETIRREDSRACGFEGYYQPVTIVPEHKNLWYFDSFEEQQNVDIYIKKTDADDAQFVKYDNTTKKYVQFKTEAFTVYAKVKNKRVDSYLKAKFSRFPEVHIKPSLGDQLSNQTKWIEDLRKPVSIEDIDTENCNTDRFFEFQAETLFNIGPSSQLLALKPGCNAIEFLISEKLNRLFITSGERNSYKIPQVLFYNPNEDDAWSGIDLAELSESKKINLDGLTTLEIINDDVQEKPSDTTSSNAVNNDPNNMPNFYATLLKCGQDGNSGCIDSPPAPFDGEDVTHFFHLKIHTIKADTYIYIDLIPNIVNFYISNYRAFLGDPAHLKSKLQGSLLLNQEAEILKGGTDIDLVGDSFQARNNQVVTLNLLIRGANERLKYYISDIYEDKKPDDSNEQPLSRLGDYASHLKNGFYFSMATPLGVQSNYLTKSITSDTDIYAVIDTYNNISVTFTDAETCVDQNLGKIKLDYSGLKKPYPLNGETFKYYPCNTSRTVTPIPIKPNRIYISAIMTDLVGFRRFDDAHLAIIPDPGYYIKSVIYSTSNTANAPTVNILSDLPDTPDYLSSKRITFSWDQSKSSATGNGFIVITKNAHIEVDFEKKPSLQSLSPFLF